MKRSYSLAPGHLGVAGRLAASYALALLPLAAWAQAPTITGVSPVPGTRNAPPTNPVQVSFSQPLAGSSAAALQVYSAQRGGRRTHGTTPAVVSGSQLTYTPPAAQPWLPGETVLATVTKAAAGSGGTLAQSKVFQFTAATAPATGVFAGGSAVVLPRSYTTGVAVGDVDGDGDLDFITADNGESTFTTPGTASVRLNGGDASGSNTGTFSNGSTVAVDNKPNDVVLGDVDGDGDLDLLTANTNNGNRTVNVRLNGGDASGSNTGTFSNGSTIALASASKILLGDVDGDGDLDLIASGGVVRLNGGDASGSNTGTFSNGSTTAGAGAEIVLGDVDGDGDLDLLTVGGQTAQGLGTVLVFLNGGNATGSNTGVFSLSSTVLTGSSTNSLALGDVDGDGDLDIVTGNQGFTTATASVRLNGGDASGSNTGTFSNGSTATIIAYLNDIALGDVDGDGDLDLLAAGGDLRGGVSVVLNGGDTSGSNTGIFSNGNTVSGTGPRPAKIALGDVNGDGTLDLLTANYFGTGSVSVLLNSPAYPTITSFSAYRGPVGTRLLITGSRFNTTTNVAFNGTPAPGFVVVSATQLLVSVPAGATTGLVTVTNAQATATSAVPFTVTNAPVTAWTGAAGTDWFEARNWTAGVPTATFDALIPMVSTAYPVLSSGTATAGSLTLSPGATLTQSGGTLNLTGDLTANGTFAATGGTVATSGSAFQYLGGTNPLALQNLTIGAAGATLGTAMSFRRVLTLVGNLTTNGQALTLRSSVSGGVATDGLVVNSGGVVVGTATVQRAIDPSLNPGLGYRHYSSPVSNSTVADLATITTGGSFMPVVNPAYNTPTSLAALPFPNVFGYSDGNITRTANLPTFDKGYYSPAALSDALEVCRGYTVNIRANEVVAFRGTLNNGNQALYLNSIRPGYAEGGWQLLGNPYPAPLDYSLVDPADRDGLEAAIYVYSSTSQYGGRYRTYVNGIGNPVLPVGQGFFARMEATRTSSTFIRFRNSQRLTTPNATAFQRTAADPRPQVQLELTGASLTDTFIAYAETGTTPAFDTDFDAAKLPNPTSLNLSSVATSGESLAIDGRPAFTAATALPLAVSVPTAGTYTLSATSLANLPTGLDAYLADAQTGQLTKLSLGGSYTFSVSPTQAAALLTGRFSLLFRPAAALATTNSLSAESVGVYPNPAHERFTVMLPGLAHATTVQAELLNGLGQVVRRQAAALPTAGTQFSVETTGLATGVYTLRLQAGPTTLAKRVVVW